MSARLACFAHTCHFSVMHSRLNPCVIAGLTFGKDLVYRFIDKKDVFERHTFAGLP